MGIEELKAKREALRAEYAEAEAKQAEIDLAALLDAEQEHGFGAVRSLKVRGYKKGLPTMAIVKSPGGTPFYRKYLDELANAKSDMKKRDAALALGRACIIYPPKGDVLDAMLDAFPGLPLSASMAAQKLAELETDEEKKD